MESQLITINLGDVLLELIQLERRRFLLTTNELGILVTLRSVSRGGTAPTMGFEDIGDNTFIGKFFGYPEARVMAERCVLRGCIHSYTITGNESSTVFIVA